ncbi:MAG: thermosome subunit beta, partial [Candidatus Asgardarchaeia archaeon]
KNIAMTAMASKVVSADREALAKIAVEAVKSVAEKQNGKVTVNLDNIKVVKKEGAKISETKLVKGVILDKELAHPDMPKEINNPKILLTNAPLEVEKTEFDAHIRIDSPDEIQLFKKQEEKMVLDMVEKIVKSGANVVLSQKGINDIAKSFLAKNGIMAVARVNKKDIERLAKAAGARILTSLEEIPEDALGEAEKVREIKIGDSKFVFIEGCKNSKAISILLRAGTKMVVEEAERALHDTLFVVKDVVEDGTFVVGGGAIEAEIAKRIRDYSESVSGKAQLAVKIFADAIEVIPRALSENAGLSVIDIISELRKAHNEGNIYAGINLKTGKVENLLDAGVIEPTRVKVQALKTASEVARMILRIDDVIASKRKAPPRPPGGPGGYGGPAGMGGFGGGMPPGM